MSRAAKLLLNWSRRDLYLQRKARDVANYPQQDETSHLGGSDDHHSTSSQTASMAQSTAINSHSRWTTALGPCLPELASLELAQLSSYSSGAEPGRKAASLYSTPAGSGGTK
jgi:hypothetical protein